VLHLRYLGEIQSLLYERRMHQDDVSAQLHLLRQVISDVQRLNHNKLQSAVSLKKLHQTLIKEGVYQAKNRVKKERKEQKRQQREPGAVYRGDEAPSLIRDVSKTFVAPDSTLTSPPSIEQPLGRVPAAAGPSATRQEHFLIDELSGLPPQIQELLLKPEYKSLILDSSHLSYRESVDSPSGGFGVVHNGTYLGQPVVVKMLLSKDPTFQSIKEILDEALVMKQYNFEYFATVYGICVVEGSPAIVMKRMDSDLFCYLHKQENKDVTNSFDWKIETAIAVSKAVEALHSLKILHRDLKSPNILVGGKRAELLCITDFGMAQLRKEIASLRKSQSEMGLGKHETVGSYPWMAPGMLCSLFVPESNKSFLFFL